jgi:DNA polymerase V
MAPDGTPHYTVVMSSIPANPPNPIRVGKEQSGGANSTRASVAIGFGSPSGDTGVTRLDLNDVLVKHPQATFLMRITGGAMREIGIDTNDLVLVDRAITPSHGHVVIAVADDEFVCRHLFKKGRDVRLQATGTGHADIVASEGTELQLWGVVTQVIKSMPV